MNYLASDKAFLLNILKAVEKQTLELKCHDLCYIAELIALLKDGLSPGHPSDTPKKNDKEPLSDTTQTTERDELNEERSGETNAESKFVEREESSFQSGKSSIEQELQQSCDAILTTVGAAATKNAPRLPLGDIRRLLAVYSLLPFQDDALIESLFSVVTLRKTHLELLPRESLGSLLRTARSRAESIKDTAIGNIETESVFEQLKNGFMSFFSSMEATEPKESDDKMLTEELLALVQDCIDKASMASKSAEDLQRALGVSIDSILSRMKRGTAFELAQCKELIENYHRINFVTGKSRSRYDKARARDIAKRVLGRLLP